MRETGCSSFALIWKKLLWISFGTGHLVMSEWGLAVMQTNKILQEELDEGDRVSNMCSLLIESAKDVI